MIGPTPYDKESFTKFDDETPEQIAEKKKKCGGVVIATLIGVCAIVLLLFFFKVTNVLKDFSGDCYTGCCTWEGMEYCPGDCIYQGWDNEYYCPASEDERVMLIHDVTAEDAICNDGTRARLHYRESLPGDNENKWIFRFEGGNLCYDVATCDQRTIEEPAFITAPTSQIIYQDPVGGMYSGNDGNPLYRDYNAISTHYCSSDVWIGQSWAEDNEVDWNFRGFDIMIGSFEEALEKFALENATEIVVTGFSAGCFGLIGASDFVFEWFESKLPGVPVHMLCDSGWFLDSADYLGVKDNSSQAETELGVQMSIGYDNWNPVTSLICETELSGWECTIPEYNWQYLLYSDQIFVSEAGFDSMQHVLHVARDLDGHSVEEAADYFVYLAEAVLESLLDNGVNFVSSNCENHDSVNRHWFYEIHVEGETLPTWFQSFKDGAFVQVYDDMQFENGTSAMHTNPTCPDTESPPHID